MTKTSLRRFVLGFVYSPDGARVLLLRKRPTDRFNPNRWNGIGGHIEPDESASQAMARETEEETGLGIAQDAWTLMGALSDGETFHVTVFEATANIDQAQAQTDEPIQAFSREAIAGLDLAWDVDGLLAPWLNRVVAYHEDVDTDLPSA